MAFATQDDDKPEYMEKEVFETSDSESLDDQIISASSILKEEDPANQEIDITKLQSILEKSRTNFNRQFVSASLDTDFSDSVIKGVSGYNSYSTKETYAEKLQRIKFELEELKAMKEAETSEMETHKNKVTVEQLYKLLGSLEVVDSSGEKPTVQPLNIEVVNIPQFVDNTVSAQNTVSPSEVKDLESRISNLEKLTGFGEVLLNKNSSNFQTFESVVNDLNQKFNLLVDIDTEGHTKEISEKDLIGNKTVLKNTLEEMESINKEIILNNKKLTANQSFFSREASTNAEISQPETDAGFPATKIEKLYNLLYRNEKESSQPLTAEINEVLKRVSSLNYLYLEYESTMQLSKNSNKIVDGIKQDYSNWESVLKEINEKLSELSSNLEQNKQQVNNWIKQLHNAPFSS